MVNSTRLIITLILFVYTFIRDFYRFKNNPPTGTENYNIFQIIGSVFALTAYVLVIYFLIEILVFSNELIVVNNQMHLYYGFSLFLSEFVTNKFNSKVTLTETENSQIAPIMIKSFLLLAVFFFIGLFPLILMS